MGKQFAVFVESSYYVPGDERSKTNPGHGYPEQNVEFTEVVEFADEEELRKWIARYHDTKKFRAFKLSPIYFSKEISIKMDGV